MLQLQHLELSSLEKFSKYDIRVLAVTAAGAGPASSVLTVMTDEKGKAIILFSIHYRIFQFYSNCAVYILFP